MTAAAIVVAAGSSDLDKSTVVAFVTVEHFVSVASGCTAVAVGSVEPDHNQNLVFVVGTIELG